MLHINVIAVGRLKQRFWVEACDEYLKRLSRYARVAVLELGDRDPASSGGEAAAREAETLEIARRLAKISAPVKPAGAERNAGRRERSLDSAVRSTGSSYTILLDRAGLQLSSEELAQLVRSVTIGGVSTLNLVIGGSTGVNAAQLPAVDKIVSLGKITLPHNLARVVCLEQLYRVCKINAGEPYHK